MLIKECIVSLNNKFALQGMLNICTTKTKTPKQNTPKAMTIMKANNFDCKSFMA